MDQIVYMGVCVCVCVCVKEGINTSNKMGEVELDLCTKTA